MTDFMAQINDILRDHPVDFLTQVFLPALHGEVADTVTEALRDYASGEDGKQLRDFAVSIAGDFARAMARGDRGLIEDLEQQVHLVAELHRIKLKKRADEVVLRILTVVGQVAFKLAQGAVEAAIRGLAQGLVDGLSGGVK